MVTAHFLEILNMSEQSALQ